MKESKRLKYEKRICELENELAKQAYRTLSSKILGARYLPVHHNCRSWQAPMTNKSKINKHIELVKKWLANPASVTQQELGDNNDAADAAAQAVAYAANVSDYADKSPEAAASGTSAAAYWVRRYEELTK